MLWYIFNTTFVSDDNEYSLDYLKYVTDSIYYPSKLDLVSENEVANRDVSMYFYDLNNEKLQKIIDLVKPKGAQSEFSLPH